MMTLVSLMLEVMKRKGYRSYNQRIKNTMESANVRIDEKFRIQERIVDYNSNDDDVIRQGMMRYLLILTMIYRMKESQSRNKSQNLY